MQLLPDLTGASSKAKVVGSLTVEQMTSTLDKTLPKEAADEIKDQITRLQKDPPFALLSLGLVITIWLASSLFVAVIDAMNRIYGVKERRNFFKLRFIAIVMTVVQAAILVGSLLAVVGSNVLFNHLGLGASGAFLATVTLYVTVFVMVLLSFALTYFVAPDADQSWEWITPGSVAGSLLFLGATFLFRIYVHNFANYDKTYGPLGGVMVLLFWFWISSLILLGSAQVNKLIEEASPLGKNYGQRKEARQGPRLRGHGAATAQSLTPDRPARSASSTVGRARSGKLEASRVVSSETSGRPGLGEVGLRPRARQDERRVEPEGGRGPPDQIEPAHPPRRRRRGSGPTAPPRPGGRGPRRPSPGPAGSGIRPRRRPGAGPTGSTRWPGRRTRAGRTGSGRRAGSGGPRPPSRSPARGPRPPAWSGRRPGPARRGRPRGSRLASRRRRGRSR